MFVFAKAAELEEAKPQITLIYYSATFILIATHYRKKVMGEQSERWQHSSLLWFWIAAVTWSVPVAPVCEAKC